MTQRTKKKVLIIGGGPAGLTAAYEFLRQTDIEPVVVEHSDFLGGISRTEEIDGNRIDIGGHRFFSKSDRVMDWWQQFMPIQASAGEEIRVTYHNKQRAVRTVSEVTDPDEVMLVRKRKSRVFYRNRFFDYPISLSVDTLRKLGPAHATAICTSYLRSLVFPIKDVRTLEDFFINRFGERLYRTFFKDYTEKVWGVPCTDISAEWGAQRIKGLSITKTLLDAGKKLLRSSGKAVDIGQKNTETSLIEYFLYPKYGPGQMWELVGRKIEELGGTIRMRHTAVGLINSGRRITGVEVYNEATGTTEVIEADYVLSTMPIRTLVESLRTPAPPPVRQVAAGLTYRDFITVGLLLDNLEHDLEDTWIYVQENYVHVGRIQIFNNWSPHMVRDANKTWVGLEYFCNVGDAVWSRPNAELAELALAELKALRFIREESRELKWKVIRAPKSYPGYFGTYDRFAVVRDYLDGFDNLFLAGRNGLHKYNNQDHSMLTSMKVVELIQRGETDKREVWDINTEEDYHEEK